VTATRPDPIETPDTAFFWAGAARGELLGLACADCGDLQHPPRPMCPRCFSTRREERKLSGHGRVLTWIFPRHPAPIGFAEPPIVALIDLDEGIRLVSNLVGVAPDAITAGMPVTVAFAPTAGGKAVPVFRPAASAGAARAERSAHAEWPRPAQRAAGERSRSTAIVGIGQTEFSKNSGRSELQLAAEAVKAACDDAGIAPAEIDGLITFTLDPSDEIGLIRCLGIEDLAFTTRIPGGGAASVATIHQASAAVASGAAEVVVCWRAMNERSQYRFGQPQAGGMFAPGSGTSSLLWCMPFGAQTPGSWAALRSRPYLDAFGVTNRDLGRLSVVQRAYAAKNPAAWFYQKPITLEEHQASRWVVEPVLRLLDCCQESDGGVALVVTTLERARRLRQPPARIVASAQSIPFNAEVISNYYDGDLSVMPEAVGTAKRLWQRSGLGPGQIQAAMLYDAFTPQVLMQLEAFGFCGRGEAKDFIAAGEIELGGRLPVNTHGGLLGEAYIHGMNSIAEGVRQVRGSSVSQARDVEHVLVSCAMAGAILGRV
jgi:acetyl-CoA acetyltransferase/uncharacterized OB-fold protein